MSPEAPPSVLAHRLASRLQGFLDRLREEGVRAGVGAGVDLSRALPTLPLLDRETVREACRATLAKSPSDLAIVDRVFEQYFGALLPVPPPSEEGKVPSYRERHGGASGGPKRRSSAREEVVEKFEGRYSPMAPSPLLARGSLPPELLRRYRAGARQFRRTVATLPGRRWQPDAVGAVDLRRTARGGLRSAGEWVELARRDRAPRRADLVVLWDVSGSMLEHTPVLFGLVHALHRSVRRTRVFAFGHDIVEITPLFAGRSYERALPLLADRLRPTGGGTRIAHCLREFRRRHGSEVRRTSAVLVLSDGWDLGEPQELADELRRLYGQAHSLTWVNPYAAKAGFRPATAALLRALPYIDLLTSPDDFPESHGVVRGRPRGAAGALA